MPTLTKPQPASQPICTPFRGLLLALVVAIKDFAYERQWAIPDEIQQLFKCVDLLAENERHTRMLYLFLSWVADDYNLLDVPAIRAVALAPDDCVIMEYALGMR